MIKKDLQYIQGKIDVLHDRLTYSTLIFLVLLFLLWATPTNPPVFLETIKATPVTETIVAKEPDVVPVASEAYHHHKKKHKKHHRRRYH